MPVQLLLPLSIAAVASGGLDQTVNGLGMTSSLGRTWQTSCENFDVSATPIPRQFYQHAPSNLRHLFVARKKTILDNCFPAANCLVFSTQYV